MTLDDLIAELEKQPRDRVLRRGFAKPHSYRGSYCELAVEPAENVSVGSMLDALTTARDTTMHGYKGGEYVMHGGVDVYLARYSETGEQIGIWVLAYLLDATNTVPPTKSPDPTKGAPPSAPQEPGPLVGGPPAELALRRAVIDLLCTPEVNGGALMPTIGARLRQALNDARGNLHPEAICEECTRPFEPWHADTDDWERVTGKRWGGPVLCETCFAQRLGPAPAGEAVEPDDGMRQNAMGLFVGTVEPPTSTGAAGLSIPEAVAAGTPREDIERAVERGDLVLDADMRLASAAAEDRTVPDDASWPSDDECIVYGASTLTCAPVDETASCCARRATPQRPPKCRGSLQSATKPDAQPNRQRTSRCKRASSTHATRCFLGKTSAQPQRDAAGASVVASRKEDCCCMDGGAP